VSKIRSFVIVGAALLAAGAASAQGNQQQRTLPDGEGKPMVEAVCASCHGVNSIFGSAGYDEAGWRHVVGAMIALPDTQARTVTAYLAKNFPPHPARRPTRTQGNRNAKFTEWIAPTLGQRVRDPLEARDGAIWWTGMFASLVGRRDPVTGEMKEFKLPDGSRPHGIAEDASGNIWFTGNGNGTVGRVARAPEREPLLHGAGRAHVRPVEPEDG
jgi:virginiamycin B lyase